MNTRVRTAAIALPLFLAVLLFGGSVLFGVLVAVAVALGMYEYLGLVSPDENPVARLFAVVWGGVIVLGFLAPSPVVPGLLLSLGVAIYLGLWICGPGPTDSTLRRWGGIVGGWVLVAFFLGHAVWVRESGVAAVLFPMLIIWVGDTAAYYAGTAFGEHPLAPAVSPKKSIEGAVASLVAGVAMAGAATLLLPLPHGFGYGLALGVLINVLGQFGDLAESLLKRCSGTKDSGMLFPGHGGILDRVDGLLLVFPVYAAFLSMGGG